MTVKEVEQMMIQFMAAYKKAEFQIKLHDIYNMPGLDDMAKGRKRQELCLPYQMPIIAQYGFEESKKGVAQSVAAANAVFEQYTESMKTMHFQLSWLVNPDEQKGNPNFVPDAEVPEPEKPEIDIEDFMLKGATWKVIGGRSSGGIVVRKSEALNSPVLRFKLVPDAKVQVEEVVNSRLHYKRLSGDGPDFGWVSLQANGKMLLEPCVA